MDLYAPGRDAPPAPDATEDATLAVFDPSQGAGGVFARDIQGATPKYARNEGARSDHYRNTLSRFMVRVDQGDRDLFRRSISDPVLSRSPILDAISGDPRGNRGYIDFLMTNANLGFQELIQVGQVLSGNHVVYTFDQAPPTLQFQGVTLNTVQDDQTTHMIRLYLHVLRATALARRQKALSIKMDAYVLTGVLTAFTFNFEAKFETAVPFNASFLVKRLAIVEYTSGWRPTSVSSAFASDLNAVPADTRVYTERPVNALTFRRPGDLAEDVARGTADARVGSTPPAAQASPNARVTLLESTANQAQTQLTTAERQLVEAVGRQIAARNQLGSLTPTDERYRQLNQANEAAGAELSRLQTQVADARRVNETAQNELRAARAAAPTPSTTPAPTAPLPPGARSGPAPETVGRPGATP